MSMVEELKRRMASIADAESTQADDDYSLASDEAYYFLRDHGQALVEAVERGERYRDALVNIRDSTFRSAVTLRGYAHDRLNHIDLARTKAGAGGGS